MSAKKKIDTNVQPSAAELMHQQVEAMGGIYMDSSETSWKVTAVHHNASNYLRYVAEIDGDRAEISGPHCDGLFFVHRYWKDGKQLLDSLGAYYLSNIYFTNLEDAINWAHNATREAEKAVNRHINQGRANAAIRVLEKEKEKEIEAANQKYEEAAAEIYKKASFSPESCDL